MNEPSKAIQYFQRALELDKQSKNELSEATSLFNIGLAYKNLDHYENALEKYQESLLIFTRNSFVKEKANVLNYIAELKFLQKDFTEAEKQYETALVILSKLGHLDGLANTYMGLAQCYLESKDIIKAITYGKKSLELAKDLGYPERIRKAAYILSRIGEKTGDYQSAFNYLKQLILSLISSMKGFQNKINLKVDAQDVLLNIYTSVPIGLIINEIVTNSLKYGFEHKEKGIITVRIKKLKYPNFVLEIGDNGIGTSKDLDITRSKSLGLSLINNLTEQLMGNVEYDYSKKGIHYIINFKEISEDSDEIDHPNPIQTDHPIVSN